jgi:polysaccharide biosynthesis transport protein
MPVNSNQPPHQQVPYQSNGHSSSPVIISTPVAALYQRDELDLNQILTIVRRRAWLIGGVAIAATSAIWFWTLTRTPIYRGEFRVLVEPVSETDQSRQILQNDQIQIAPTFDYATQIEVLQSPALLEPIAQSLQQTYPDITIDTLTAGLVITQLKTTKVLSVSYLGTDPAKVQAVLRELSQQYLRYSFEQRQSNLQQGVQFVEGQLPELRERVNTLQVRLERFRQRYSLVDPESRGTDLASLINGVEKESQDTQTQLSEARSLYRVLQQQLGLSASQALAATALSESPRYQNLLNQLQEVETQIAEESARFRPDSPYAYSIQALQDKRAELLPLLSQEAERILGERAPDVTGNLTSTSLDLSRQLVDTANQVRVLETRRDALAAVEERLKQEFELVPALAREYTDLQRELTIATESLNRFLATRETLQINAAQKSIPWELISGPATPSSPISPNSSRNLVLGAIAGLLLGTAAAFAAEKLDSVFHSPDDLKALTKLPLLGVVPFAKELQLHPAATTAVSANSPEQAENYGEYQTFQRTHGPSSYHSSPFFEAFRSLYANIRFLSSDTPIRSLVISSATPGEGKSTTSLNLARAAAAMGQRVLLVDADLRRPQLHRRLNIINLRGLSNVIVSEMRLEQVWQRSPHDEGVYILPAGSIPPDPVKLLSSRRMQGLMEQMQAQFDLVIYDTPPILGFADSNLLAAHTDGMVLVVGLGKTDQNALTQALETIKISPVSVLGLVTNGVKAYTSQTYSYYRYQHYYTSLQAQTSDHSSQPHAFHPVITDLHQRVSSVLANSVQLLSTRLGLMLLGGLSITVLLGLLSWMVYQRLITIPNEAQPRSTAPNSSFVTTSLTTATTTSDPFTAAVQLASLAAIATEKAHDKVDWQLVASQWQQAADLMATVPTAHDQYAIAQDRVSLYRSNSQYARQQAE